MKGKILIVDDERNVCEMLSRGLQREGYECKTSLSGAEALDKMTVEHFELVLLDIKMPGLSGMEVLEEIRALYPDTSVVMITALVDTPTAIEAMKKGAYDYILKPFKIEELCLSVARALEVRRLRLDNKEFQKNLEKKVQEQAEQIRQLYVGAVQALATTLEAKGHHVAGHSVRVAQIAVSIAEQLSLPHEQIVKLRLAALLHNIGEIAAKEAALQKVTELRQEVYGSDSPGLSNGGKILTDIVGDEEIIQTIKHHKQRYDGTDSPEGLRGEAIPLAARILAVADAYDSLTSPQPHRKVLPGQKALEEIEKSSESQFDPRVVAAFLKTWREGQVPSKEDVELEGYYAQVSTALGSIEHDF